MNFILKLLIIFTLLIIAKVMIISITVIIFINVNSFSLPICYAKFYFLTLKYLNFHQIIKN